MIFLKSSHTNKLQFVGVPQSLIQQLFFVRSENEIEPKIEYNEHIVDYLLNIVSNACQSDCKIRPVTLELALKLTLQIVEKKERLNEQHRAIIYAARAQCMSTLRSLYQHEMFLDMFEYELVLIFYF